MVIRNPVKNKIQYFSAQSNLPKNNRKIKIKMTKISRHCFIAILALCCIAFQKSFAKPAAATALESGPDPAAVSAVAVSGSTDEDDSLLRDQRSPDYGLSDYYDYSDEGSSSSSRHYKNKHKHKPTYVPVPVYGGHGCRRHGHNCGGSYNKPSYEGGSHHGASASASAGSFSSGHHGGTQSQAQSTSFSFGPISFSAAQAQSSRIRENYGGYGGYGGYGYDY